MATRKILDKKNPQKKAPLTNKLELSSSTPIPFEGGVGFSFVGNTRYIPFLQGQINYAELLLESRLLSVTHNACINTKRNYLTGSGFRQADGTELSKEMLDWFKSVNLRDQNILQLSKKLFDAFLTFGNVPLEIVRFTVLGVKHCFVYVHNFLEWRLGEANKNDISTYAIQSKLFRRSNVQLTEEDYKKSKKLPIYSSKNVDKSAGKEPREGYNWITDDNGAERTLIWYKNEYVGFDHYGLPSAVSGLIYQNLEYKGARFNLDNFDNNMVVSAILALKGSITQNEANRIGKEAIRNHTGDGKRGRMMVVASEDGIDGSDLHSMDTYKEGSYKESDLHWSEKIILANEWDAVLAGIMSPSSLGKGSGFITKILEIKKNTVVKPAQHDTMINVWHKIFKIASDWIGFKDNIDTIEIADWIDISGLTDVDITPAVTVNEVRNAKGLPDDKTDKGKKYLAELGADQKRGVYVKETKPEN